MSYELTDKQRAKISEIMQGMSLRDKIGQITCVSIARYLGNPDNDMETYKRRIDETLEKIPVGNIFLGAEIIQETTEGAARTREVLKYMQRKCKIPMLVAGDIERGVGSSVKGMTIFPNQMTFAAMDDEEIAYETGKLAAVEARAIGFNWCFGPVVDLYRDWIGCGNGRMISDDADMTIKIAKALIRGMQDYGMAAAGKHFPDGNDDFRNPHIANVVSKIPEDEWYKTDGRIYDELNKAGMMSVMSGHISLRFAEEFNEEQNAYCPASLSPVAIDGILRGKLGFEGVVVTDSAGMGGYKMWKTQKERVKDVFKAGNDILLFPEIEDFETIEEAIKSGEISEERIDESVRRILEMKAKIGLFDDVEDTYKDIGKIMEEAGKLNDLLSKKCVTCVRNLDNLLPLKKDEIKRVLVMRIDSGAKTGPVATVINELEKMGIEVDVYDIPSFTDWSKTPDMIVAEKEGRKWDAYLQLYNYAYIGSYRPDGNASLALWRGAGIESVKPILISFASPYLLYDMPNSKTYITTFSSRSDKVAKAVVKAIFGEEEFNYNVPIKDICDDYRKEK